MKSRKYLITLALVASAFMPIAARAFDGDIEIKQRPMTGEEKVCACVLCLLGEIANGGPINDCKAHMIAFYSIEIITDLVFNPKKTLQARRDYLSLCSFADKNQIAEANNSDRRSDTSSGYYLVDGTALTWYQLYELQLEYGIDIVDLLVKKAIEDHNN